MRWPKAAKAPSSAIFLGDLVGWIDLARHVIHADAMSAPVTDRVQDDQAGRDSFAR